MENKTRLSVNINKIALIRNSRGSNFPDLIKLAKDCEAFGAQGITVHPRPDERHVRYDDIPQLKPIVKTEFNIEGNPNPKFLQLVMDHLPHQCTLVPDAPDALTSDTGWDTVKHASFLTDIIQQMHEKGIRVSVFVNPIEQMIEGAKAVGADRIELYTGDYAKQFKADKAKAVADFSWSAKFAGQIGIGVNAGHDLNLDNLEFFVKECGNVLEVSIGHALVVDALYYGLHNTIQMYLKKLE